MVDPTATPSPEAFVSGAQVREFKPVARARANEPAYQADRTTEGLPAIAATPFRWRDPAEIPRRQFLGGGRHWARQFVSVTVAPGGVGKSNLLIAEMMASAAGRQLLHDRPDRPLRVWYWNGEDPADEIERRVHAVCLHYGINPEDVGDRLFVDSGRVLPLTLAKDTRNGTEIMEPVRDAIIATMKANRIDVLSIDPFVKSHEVSENENSKIDLVFRQWSLIAQEANCAVDLIHHVRKSQSGENGDYSIDDSRGAKALIDGCRSGRVLNRMSRTQAEEAGIDPNLRWAFLYLTDGKRNLAPPSEKLRWFHLASQSLPNGSGAAPGDSVGVMTPWEWPDADEITGDQLASIRAVVGRGDCRENVQASDWIGRRIAPLLGLDPDGDRKQLLRIIGAQIACGNFRRESRQDAKKGRDVPYIVLGEVEGL